MNNYRFMYPFYLSRFDTIVQISAYDGVECEQEYGLRQLLLDNNFDAHLIEPLKDKYNLLLNNYPNEKGLIKFYNFAIYDKDGEEKFYLNTTESSFVRHTENDYCLVNTKTLPTFIKENNITKIDGLFLDVEGVEDIIINDLFSKTSIRPKIIRYEFPHLKNEQTLIELIKSNNYEISTCAFTEGDRVCVRKDLL